MKRVLVGALMQESNSFSPRPSVWSDFHVVTGPAMLAWIAAAPVFAEAGIEMVPTLYAYSVPGGILQEESYLRFKKQILDGITADSRLDGVWLYLHGALEVERVGSGEADLVSAIRQKVGPDVPIAVALDFHANNTQRIMDNANIVYGYRTAPHIDEAETQEKTARLLIRCMEEGLLPRPVMVRPPLLFPGEMATTCIEPLLSLMREVARAESAEGILCASFLMRRTAWQASSWWKIGGLCAQKKKRSGLQVFFGMRGSSSGLRKKPQIRKKRSAWPLQTRRSLYSSPIQETMSRRERLETVHTF